MRVWLVGVGALLSVGLLVFFIASEVATRRIQSDKKFYYTVSADLTVGGQPVSINATTECKWVQKYNPLLPLLPLVTDTSHYRMVGGPAARRLADGTAVLIVLPNLCGKQTSGIVYDKDPQVVRTLHKRLSLMRRWYLARLDNSSNPEVVKVFVGPEYFDQGADDLQDADRIKLNHLEVAYSKTGRLSMPDEEVPWLMKSSELGRDKVSYVGYYARIVSRDEWSKAPRFAETISAIERPSYNVYASLKPPFTDDEQTILSESGKLIPLEEDSSNLVISESSFANRWEIDLRPYADGNQMRGCDGLLSRPVTSQWSPGGHAFWIGDRRVVSSLGTVSTIYDPATGFLINVGRMCLRSGELIQ